MATIQGKVMGGMLGLMAGGVMGAAFGLVIGHMYDHRAGMESQNPGSAPWVKFGNSYRGFIGTTQQAAFTMGVIVLGAKMAKADGRVTRAEIDAFKRVFNVSSAQEYRVGKLFNKARMSANGFEPYAMQLAEVFKSNAIVLEEILGGLFIIAASDDAGLRPAEIIFLKRVAGFFRINDEAFARIAARAGVRLPGEMKPRNERLEAYEILGIAETATADEVKLAYRALIREHHPDRLMAQGMPPEFVKNAEEKMKRINVAYDVVCKIKGIK